MNYTNHPARINKTGICHLTDLPRELRDEILLYTLQPKIFLHFRSSKIWPPTHSSVRQPALSHTSRQLRAEVLPLFYGKTTFHIEFDLAGDIEWQLQRVNKWLSCIKEHIDMIQRIRFMLCEKHSSVMAFTSQPGTQTVYKLFHFSLERYEEVDERCTIRRCFQQVEKDRRLQNTCAQVGNSCFGPEEYMAALRLFFFPDHRRCRPLPVLDDDLFDVDVFDENKLSDDGDEQDQRSRYGPDGEGFMV